MTEIGQFMKSSEAQRFVTGSGCFVDDLTFPNMAHAVILRSVHARAVLKSVDTSAAAAHTRVITV